MDVEPIPADTVDRPDDVGVVRCDATQSTRTSLGFIAFYQPPENNQMSFECEPMALLGWYRLPLSMP